MKPISKDKLKGKFVAYRDRHDALRVNRVVKITGNTLTVKDANGSRRRVHLKNVEGRVSNHRYGLDNLQLIEWKQRRG